MKAIKNTLITSILLLIFNQSKTQIPEITNFTYYNLYNYIFSKTILHLPTGTKHFIQTFQYFDGLGRSSQIINFQASPTYKDIIQPIEYDPYGRETKKYLPYTESSNGVYRSNWKSQQQVFYTSTMGYTTDGSKAYSETVFDNSPLNRVMKQGAPGDAWKVDNTTPFRQSSEHVVSNQYSANTTDVVYFWTIAGTYPSVTFSRQTYQPNTLYKTIISDENNNQITEYKDKQGKVVLKVDALEGRTYYIYDDFDLLRCVIPPLASLIFGSFDSPLNFTISNTHFKELCYYYEYDHRHRMIKKKLPGTVGVYEMTYDCLDRLIETKDPNGTRIYTKYDIFSRPIETGNAATGVWLTKTHYDSYVKNSIYYESELPYIQSPYGYDYTKETKVKGKITVTITRVLNPETGMKDSIRSVIYYDKYGRVIQTVSENHLGGREIVSHQYKYKNSEQIDKTKRCHWKSSFSGDPNQTVVETFLYDYAGRLKRIWHKINSSTDQTLEEMSYNEIGQLIRKNPGLLQNIDYKYNIRGWLTQINNPYVYGSSGKFFNLKLVYVHDEYEKGYNGNIMEMMWSDKVGKQKYYYFDYDNTNRLINGSYEEYYQGNWVSYSDKYKVSFTYDANGNILCANRRGIVDDGIGLIGDIDLLTYKYFNDQKSNRLYAVGDGASDVLGRGDFSEYTSNGCTYQEFGYDNNGNMIWDYNRTNYINHNYLNLPQLAHDDDGHNIYKFSYDANGMKLRQISYLGTQITNDYIGPFVYKNGVLDYIITSEGRAGGALGYYEFNIKDHLGNIRATFKKNGSSAQLLQQNDYYPFGMLMSERYDAASNKNKFLYNGKEQLKTFSTNYSVDMSWYDYGARMYDPQLGRWHVIDNKAEKYSFTSPYTYALNNPIKFLDPDGNDVIIGSLSNNHQVSLQRMLSTNAGRAFIGRYMQAGTELNVGGKVYTWKVGGDRAKDNLIIKTTDNLTAKDGSKCNGLNQTFKKGTNRETNELSVSETKQAQKEGVNQVIQLDSKLDSKKATMTLGHEAFVHADKDADALTDLDNAVAGRTPVASSYYVNTMYDVSSSESTDHEALGKGEVKKYENMSTELSKKTGDNYYKDEYIKQVNRY